MDAYSIIIEPQALHDIQNAIDYYDNKQPGLGLRFENLLNEQLRILQKSPFFQVRYKRVHCFPLNKFPYMVHYTLDNEKKIIAIRAVFHTSIDPTKWKKREN